MSQTWLYLQNNLECKALQKGVEDGNEKRTGVVEQGLPRVQHRAQISRIIYRPESKESLGKRMPLTQRLC